MNSLQDRIEDAVVQADEINGKNLQFEGGLTVSSSVVSGAYALAKTVGKAPPISKMQSVKFANYFLSRQDLFFSEKNAYTMAVKNRLPKPWADARFFQPSAQALVA